MAALPSSTERSNAEVLRCPKSVALPSRTGASDINHHVSPLGPAFEDARFPVALSESYKRTARPIHLPTPQGCQLASHI